MKNNIIQFCLKTFYSIKGYIISKKLKNDQLYFGGVNNTYGYYRGNKTFYETKNYQDNNSGMSMFIGQAVKYTNLQLGLFNWKKIN